MLPIIARFGPFTLTTYSFLINLGIVFGLGWLYWRAPAAQKTAWLDVGIAATVGGFIGARLGYVSANASYYLSNLLEALMIWRGGLSWIGAAGGALLGALWYARRRGQPLLPILDALALPVALLSLLAWGGCLAAGCAYGVEVQPADAPAWFISHAPDIYGLSVPRWPTQAVGMAWGAVTLGLVAAMHRRRWAAGALACYALSLVALGAFGLSFTRGDPMPLVSGWRLDVAGGALVLVAATAAWAALVSRRASMVSS
jgi:phosphatidylglycerol:prolipoprotein diacylglycerol transferase